MSINVLIVAKERVHRKILVNLLNQLEYSDFGFLEAESGKDAINLIRSKPPLDIILLDVRLEDVGAGQLLTALRTIDIYKTTSAIVLCDDGDPNLREVRNQNIQGILIRPFDAATSKKVLGRVAYGIALHAGIRRQGRRRLLIIDNDVSFLKRCQVHLGEAFKLLISSNMEEGLAQALLNTEIDVIIVSSKLNAGWDETLKRLREQLRLPPPLVLLLGLPEDLTEKGKVFEALADGVVEGSDRFEQFPLALVNSLFDVPARRTQVLLQIVKTELLERFRSAALDRVEDFFPKETSFSFRRNQRYAADWQALVHFREAGRQAGQDLVLGLTGMNEELVSLVNVLKRDSLAEGESVDASAAQSFIVKILAPLSVVINQNLQKWNVDLEETDVECSGSLDERIEYEWVQTLAFESDTTSHKFMLQLGQPRTRNT